MNVLYIAEIVGKSGIQCVKKLLPVIKAKENIDFVIANADGVTNGSGIGKNHAGYLHKLGISVITGGDYIYYKKDLVESFSTMPYVLRPYNLPSESPGRGWKLFSFGDENSAYTQKIAVVSLLGQSGFARMHGNNPFTSFLSLIERIREETSFIIVDYHGATTAEKKAFSYFADGKVSAVFGSHGRVQTADERILPQGTACITDGGRTGSINSVGGRHAQSRISEYISGIGDWSKEAEDGADSLLQLQGLICCLGKDGTAVRIERIQMNA